MTQNFRPLVLEKIEEFSRALPSYSFCEIMFAFLSQYERNTGTKFEKSKLMGEITDQELYTHISSSLERELKYVDRPKKILPKPKYDLQENVDILYTADLTYWNTTLELIEEVQKSFSKDSVSRMEFIITKQK